jgi:hypothetical protein
MRVEYGRETHNACSIAENASDPPQKKKQTQKQISKNEDQKGAPLRKGRKKE